MVDATATLPRPRDPLRNTSWQDPRNAPRPAATAWRSGASTVQFLLPADREHSQFPTLSQNELVLHSIHQPPPDCPTPRLSNAASPLEINALLRNHVCLACRAMPTVLNRLSVLPASFQPRSGPNSCPGAAARRRLLDTAARPSMSVSATRQ